MENKFEMYDYSGFKLRKLGTERFRHIKLLLFWPIFAVIFYFTERVYHPDSYYIVDCELDSMIPFCEYFLIPYMFWFLFLAGMLLYLFLFDVPGFTRMMKFIMISYSVTVLLYLFVPTCQQLRPTSFERDNIFTRFLVQFYQFDTNTNVCPSIHVIGSLAAAVAAWHTPRFSTAGWRLVFAAVAVSICASTLFLKQHSAIDIVAALPLCLLANALSYGGMGRAKARESCRPGQGPLE